jgi:hypothetical protein
MVRAMIASATIVRKVSCGSSVVEYGSDTETGEVGFVMSVGLEIDESVLSGIHASTFV